MKIVLLAIIGVAFAISTQAAELTAEETVSLLEHVRVAKEATERGDARTIVDFTHPAFIIAVGGRQRAEEMTRTALAQMKAQGVELIGVEAFQPTCKNVAPGHLLCIVPKVTTIRLGSKTGKEHSFLLAVRDKTTFGHWMFLDGAGERQNPGVLRALLPWIPSGTAYPPNYREPLQ